MSCESPWRHLPKKLKYKALKIVGQSKLAAKQKHLPPHTNRQVIIFLLPLRLILNSQLCLATEIFLEESLKGLNKVKGSELWEIARKFKTNNSEPKAKKQNEIKTVVDFSRKRWEVSLQTVLNLSSFISLKQGFSNSSSVLWPTMQHTCWHLDTKII